jgi:hypothetical protein
MNCIVLYIAYHFAFLRSGVIRHQLNLRGGKPRLSDVKH